ncbi:cholesterol side-chain cleavage enzyme, mitochondrial isoform X3 [Salarias fasciatus]|uniref:cholesterol side-chain cleavage enzyme, mitochondrial isoform X3 n=1 Tax=Salarias fasciatus TaxID=181472 RepID=UPI001176BCC4|nr:cholesterol side-chain cleavage enzyme, mitochondrial isoform X3 [Salarias fasciatus]
MARWSMWRRRVTLPRSWMEERAASGVQYSSSSTPVIRHSESGSTVKPFEEIPGLWKNGVVNLYNFWKLDGVRNMHHIMLKNFNTFGPIYREKIGYYDSVNIINPEDAAILFKAEGHYPKRLKVEAWTSYRDYRNRKYGVLLKNGQEWKSNRVILNKEVISVKMLENFVPLLDEVGQDFVGRVHKKILRSGQNKWTTDLSQELFKYALESVSSVLYGERLGLMLDYIDPEAQHFIDCITLMFKSTSPMLYIPPGLLKLVGAKAWRDHVEAWDGIFNQADRCIQNIYRELRHDSGSTKKYPGVLASLLMLDKLSIEDIKASVTELMAGGVDTGYFAMCVADFYNSAVDAVRTGQTPQPSGGAEGRSGGSPGGQSGRHVGDPEADSSGQSCSEGNTEVKETLMPDFTDVNVVTRSVTRF